MGAHVKVPVPETDSLYKPPLIPAGPGQPHQDAVGKKGLSSSAGAAGAFAALPSEKADRGLLARSEGTMHSPGRVLGFGLAFSAIVGATGMLGLYFVDGGASEGFDCIFRRQNAAACIRSVPENPPSHS